MAYKWINTFVVIIFVECIIPSECIELRKKCLMENAQTDRLVLTPLITEGSIEEAQNLSRVNYKGFHDVKSYSGYLNVDAETGSSMFFWYFKAEKRAKYAPVILWLQGGPQMSSLHSIFLQNGPFEFDGSQKKRRFYSLNRNYHVLYLDSIGVGFSVTNKGHAKKFSTVADHLYSALIQFFKLFPNLQSNEFYIAGESYVGKSIPALAHKIHIENFRADPDINLRGLSIGNGISDPMHQLKYSEYLYQLGLVDIHGWNEIRDYEDRIKQYIRDEQYQEAYDTHQLLIGEGYPLSNTLFFNLTGYSNIFNILREEYDYERDDKLFELVRSAEFREAIHVGNTYFDTGIDILENLQLEFAQSAVPLISELLSHYRVFVYNGMLDIAVGYRVAQDYLYNMTFSNSYRFQVINRLWWIVDNDLAGYITIAGNLSSIMVRNAGHFVTMDQPKWGDRIINELTRRYL